MRQKVEKIKARWSQAWSGLDFFSKKPADSASETSSMKETFGTDWRSIMISNIVALLSSITMSSITPTVWPYMKKVDVSTTENLYGFIRGLYALGNVIFSMLSGYLCNKTSDTRPAMIIGKTIAILSSLSYCLVEVFRNSYVFFFIIFELFLGISSGVCSVFRCHIAMASTEKDRPRAFGITQLATASGFVIGPFMQMVFSRIEYPGIPIGFGMHFNLYTAPVILTALTSFVGIMLLISCFDGKMRIRDDVAVPVYTEDIALGTVDDVFLEDLHLQNSSSDSESNTTTTNHANKPKYDVLAVVVLIIVKVASEIVVLNLITICPPYAMTAFQWSSEDTVLIQSAIMGAIGVLSIVFALGYVFFKLGSRFNERPALAVALGLFFVFHLVTYPWPFLSGTIEYQHVKGTQAPLNRSMALLPEHQQLIADSKLPNSTLVIVGCNTDFAWCETTPKVSVAVFIVSLIIALGIGLPIIQINLDVLYSKVLGPIKQGTLQGVFVAAAQILNIIGPLTFSHLYTKFGPTCLWIVELTTCAVALGVYLIFYKRIVPYSERPDIVCPLGNPIPTKQPLPLPNAFNAKGANVKVAKGGVC